MGSKYFENKARRSYWSVHFEAWRRSGVSRAEYCRFHRLNESAFDRWLKVLDALESVRNKARERRKRTREPVSRDKHKKAVQAFWAMHVEALNWSGASAKDYAGPHHLSVYTLRTWRARLDADPLQVDWTPVLAIYDQENHSTRNQCGRYRDPQIFWNRMAMEL